MFQLPPRNEKGAGLNKIGAGEDQKGAPQSLMGADKKGMGGGKSPMGTLKNEFGRVRGGEGGGERQGGATRGGLGQPGAGTGLARRGVFKCFQENGWEQKRQPGSRRALARWSGPYYLFAFRGGGEIGPEMLGCIAKKTGLQLTDLCPSGPWARPRPAAFRPIIPDCRVAPSSSSRSACACGSGFRLPGFRRQATRRGRVGAGRARPFCV